MSEKDLDSLFKETLENYEAPYKVGAWEKMEKTIDSSPRRLYLLLAIPLLFIAGGLGYLSINDNSSEPLSNAEVEASFASISKPIETPVESTPAKETNAVAPSDSPRKTQSDNRRANPGNKDLKSKRVSKRTNPNPILASLGSKNEFSPQTQTEEPTPKLNSTQNQILPGFIKGLRAREKNLFLYQNNLGDRNTSENHKGSWGINAFAGLGLNPTVSTEVQNLQDIPAYLGAEVIFDQSIKWQLSMGFQYEQLNLSPVTKEITKDQFGFGLLQTTHYLTAKRISYLSFPIGVRFKFIPRSAVTLGLQYSRLLQIHTEESVYVRENNGSPELVSQGNQEGYTEGFAQEQVSVMFGYGFRIKPRLRLDLQGRYSLSPMRTEGPNSNDELQFRVGLTYFLWRK